MIVLALVVIAVAGLVGYRVWNDQQEEASPSQSNAKQVTAPENISNISDLEQASSVVEQASLDKDLNPAVLEQDIQSLL